MSQRSDTSRGPISLGSDTLWSTGHVPKRASSRSKEWYAVKKSKVAKMTECTIQDVLDVLREVGFSAAYWRELGRRLKPDLDIDAIEANHPRVEDRLEAVVSAWLRGVDYHAGAWQGLANAVQQCRSGGGRNMAEKIRQKAVNDAVSAPNSSLMATPKPTISDKPTQSQLHYLTISKDKAVRIVQEVAPHWESLAYCLGISQTAVKIVQRNHPQDVVGSCEDMLGIWLEGREGGRRPLTWTSLLEALKETGEFATLAASIESGISHC